MLRKGSRATEVVLGLERLVAWLGMHAGDLLSRDFREISSGIFCLETFLEDLKERERETLKKFYHRDHPREHLRGLQRSLAASDAKETRLTTQNGRLKEQC